MIRVLSFSFLMTFWIFPCLTAEEENPKASPLDEAINALVKSSEDVPTAASSHEPRKLKAKALEDLEPGDDALSAPPKPRKPLPPEQRERLLKLAKQLGDNQFDARESAHQEILKFGRRARTPLKKSLEDEDAEIAHRAAQIIAELNEKSEPSWSSLQWLATAQEPDGHWDTVKHGANRNADIEHTALALLAFLGVGHTERVGSYKDNVQRGVAWLRTRQREDGAIIPPGAKEVDGVAHALAAMALCEAAGMGNRPETKAAAQKATDYTTTIHQGATGFGKEPGSKSPDLLTTTLFTMHLKSAKVSGLKVQPHESFDKIIAFLDQCEDAKQSAFRDKPDGTSSTRMTIMGALSRQFLGWKKEDLAPYAEAIAKDFKPKAVGPNADMLSNWIGSMVMFQQGGELWKNWYEWQRTELFAAQCDDEGLEGSWDPAGEWLGGSRVAATALSALCLQVYYRGYSQMR